LGSGESVDVEREEIVVIMRIISEILKGTPRQEVASVNMLLSFTFLLGTIWQDN